MLPFCEQCGKPCITTTGGMKKNCVCPQIFYSDPLGPIYDKSSIPEQITVESIKKILWKEGDVFFIRLNEEKSMEEIDNIAQQVSTLSQDHFNGKVTFIVIEHGFEIELYREESKDAQQPN